MQLVSNSKSKLSLSATMATTLWLKQPTRDGPYWILTACEQPAISDP